MTVIRRNLAPPAMIVACVALLVALGGVSYAAAVLPKNSVGTAQLQKQSVSGAKLKNNAVTAAKVKNGSLLAADFKAGQLPAGPQGQQGAKGDPGTAGAPGATKVVMRETSVTTANGQNGYAIASCQPGEVATGGGWTLNSGNIDNFHTFGDHPVKSGGAPAGAGDRPVGWRVSVWNASGQTNSWRVYVICASP
jgi:hypothetical protein